MSRQSQRVSNKEKQKQLNQAIAEAKQDIGYDRLVKMGLGKKADINLEYYRRGLFSKGNVGKESLPGTEFRTTRAGKQRVETTRDTFNRAISELQQEANTKELQVRQREGMREKGQEQFKMQSRARRSSRGARSLMQQGQPTQGSLGSAGTLG